MSVLCWNVQGLGNLDKLLAFLKIIKRASPSLLFLSKTRLASARADSIKYKVGFTNEVWVDYVGRSGGLILMWREG